MRKYILLALLIVSAIPAFSQINGDTARRIQPVSVLPTVCKPLNGEVVILTTPPTPTLYQCTATNTWTIVNIPSTLVTLASLGGDGGGLVDNTAVMTASCLAGTSIIVGPGNYLISNNLTAPCNLIYQGGYFSVAVGKTLTLTGQQSIDTSLHFSGSGAVVFGYGVATGVYPEWFGAKGDNFTDSTAAINKAALAAGRYNTLVLSDGIYQVTSAPGTYALTFDCSIKGNSTTTSVIYNVGTGSAIRIYDDYGEFKRYSNFAVKGNALSEDGITTVITTPTIADVSGLTLQYNEFNSVDSYNNGRNGLVHRQSWGTRYIDCKFHDNGGLGVHAYNIVGDPFSGSGNVNALLFLNCDSRRNGGSGNNNGVYTKGGVLIESGALVSWFGGIIENNNAWGFMAIGTAFTPVGLNIQNTSMEANFNNTTSASTVGGSIRVTGSWKMLNIQNNYIITEAGVGKTDYGIFVDGDGSTNQVKINHSGNYFLNIGAGGTEIKKHITGIFSGEEQAITQIIYLSIQNGSDPASIKVTMGSRWNGDTYPTQNNIKKDDVVTGIYQLYSVTGATLTIIGGGFSKSVLSVLSATVGVNGTGTDITVDATKSGPGIGLTFFNSILGTPVDLSSLVDIGDITIEMSYLTAESNGDYN